MIAKAELSPEQFNITSQKMWLFCKYMYTAGSETFDNGTQSAQKAEYKGNNNTLRQTAHKLVTNGNVIKAKKAIMAGVNEKFDWDREQNLKHQKLQIERYNTILDANPNNLQALQGLNQVLRELNASSNQHSSTINTSSDVPEPISAERRVFLEKLALALTAAELTKPKLAQDLRKEA